MAGVCYATGVKQVFPGQCKRSINIKCIKVSDLDASIAQVVKLGAVF